MNAVVQQASSALRPAGQFDLSPQTFEQALKFADYLAKSEMVPKQYRNKPGDCLIAMQWGYEIGMKPLQALQNIAPINGKPSVFGDAGKAMLLAAGCDIDEDDAAVIKANGYARCKITRPGRTPVERTFSIDDAKTARLWGKEGPWTQYPFRQLAWRAFWFAARDAASDLLRGMSGYEEALDMTATSQAAPVEKSMGPAEVVQPEWPADRWAAGLPKWLKGIAAGKPLDEVLAWLKSKGSVTAEQEKQLRDEVAKLQQPTHQPSTDAPQVDANKLAADLQVCTDLDKLYELAGLIEAITDEAAVLRLNEIFAAKQAELEQA